MAGAVGGGRQGRFPVPGTAPCRAVRSLGAGLALGRLRRCRRGQAGVAATLGLRHALAKVTLIDRRNYHLFQPLLYPVATANLSPADIATPIRWLLSDQGNRGGVMGRAVDADTEKGEVVTSDQRIPLSRPGDGGQAQLFRQGRMGTPRPRPQEDRRRDRDSAPPPAGLRKRRKLYRYRGPAASPHLYRRWRQTHRRRDGGGHRRVGPARNERRIP